PGEADAGAKGGAGRGRDQAADPPAAGRRAVISRTRLRDLAGAQDLVRDRRGLSGDFTSDRYEPWHERERSAAKRCSGSIERHHANGDTARRLSGAADVSQQRAASRDPGNDDPTCVRCRRRPRRRGGRARVGRTPRPRRRGRRRREALALRAGATWNRTRRGVGATPGAISSPIGAFMRLLLAILIVLLATPALAQQPTTPPAEPSPPRLEPVVVESVKVPPDRTRTDEEAREELSRVPGGTAVIEQKTIEQTRAANLRDVLDFVPGVMIRPRFGAADESQLSIRGSGLRNNFHLRGINVLIDGFIYGQADGFSDFESLELLTTKRIEVYKGANALAYGGYTLGGAINVVSKTGYDAGQVELWSEAGSFLQKLHRDRAGLRAVRHLRGLRRHRARRLPRSQRAGAPPGLHDIRLRAPGRDDHSPGPRIHAQRGGAARRIDLAGVQEQSAPARPDRRGVSAGPELRLWARWPDIANAARGKPDPRVEAPARLPGPRPPAELCRDRSNHVQLGHRGSLHRHRAALLSRQSVHGRPAVLLDPADRRESREPQRPSRGRDQGSDQHLDERRRLC